MSGTGWPCRASRCTISDAACNGSSVPYRERNPDKLLFTLEYPRQDIWRWLVAGDSVKTECDERVAQRRNEPARLAPVQQHERERDMFVRLHHKIPGMRIGVVSQWPPAYCRRDISGYRASAGWRSRRIRSCRRSGFTLVEPYPGGFHAQIAFAAADLAHRRELARMYRLFWGPTGPIPHKVCQDWSKLTRNRFVMTKSFYPHAAEKARVRRTAGSSCISFARLGFVKEIEYRIVPVGFVKSSPVSPFVPRWIVSGDLCR